MRHALTVTAATAGMQDPEAAPFTTWAGQNGTTPIEGRSPRLSRRLPHETAASMEQDEP